jgi:hypothetical protein
MELRLGELGKSQRASCAPSGTGGLSRDAVGDVQVDAYERNGVVVLSLPSENNKYASALLSPVEAEQLADALHAAAQDLRSPD